MRDNFLDFFFINEYGVIQSIIQKDWLEWDKTFKYDKNLNTETFKKVWQFSD